MKKRKDSPSRKMADQMETEENATPSQKTPRRESSAKNPRSLKKEKVITDRDQPSAKTTEQMGAPASSSGLVASLSSSACSGMKMRNSSEVSVLTVKLDSEKIKIALVLFGNSEFPLPRKNRFIMEWLCGALVKSVDRTVKEGNLRYGHLEGWALIYVHWSIAHLMDFL
jgi:hypothetical protein